METVDTAVLPFTRHWVQKGKKQEVRVPARTKFTIKKEIYIDFIPLRILVESQSMTGESNTCLYFGLATFNRTEKFK